MSFNFELILFYAVIVTGVIGLFDVLFLAQRRKQLKAAGQKAKMPLICDYARAFFPVLLIVFLLRSFLFEPFRIPSSSLEPTLLVGDFILVNKYDYGMRLPLLGNKIIANGAPQRGDIMVFRWPPFPADYLIKRVIGLPGDHISYINKTLYINGEKIAQQVLKKDIKLAVEDGEIVTESEEDLLGAKHDIYIDPAKASRDYKDLVVPPGMYFVMGDNRDNSADSRYFGFVPDENIVGKAVAIWLSWDNANKRVRFDRFGKIIR